MQVERIMTILMSEDRVIGHAKVCKIGGDISMYCFVRYASWQGMDVVVSINHCEPFCLAIKENNVYYPLSIHVDKLSSLEIVGIRRSDDNIEFSGNETIETRLEELIEYYNNHKNSDTYTIVSSDNESDNLGDNVTTRVANRENVEGESEDNITGEVESASTTVGETGAPLSSDREDVENAPPQPSPSGDTIIEESNVEGAKVPFSDSIMVQLEDLFSRYEHEEVLEKRIEKSRFVRVYYEDSAYYVVGEIRDAEDRVAVICYGYPGEGGTTPPQSIKESYEWLPLDRENTSGSGYYMMYQNAVTGEVLTN